MEEHGLNEYRPWNATVTGASITVSDHEDRTGLDVAVTISLDAAHSTVTIQPRVTNSTGGPQKMQFWVNAMLALMVIAPPTRRALSCLPHRSRFIRLATVACPVPAAN